MMGHDTSKKLVATLTIILCIVLSAEDIKARNTNKLIMDLKSKDFQTRMKAVDELGKVVDEETLGIFKEYIFVKTEVWKIKIEAIDYLGMVEDRKVSDFLIKIVGDPFLNEGCPAIKRHAILALGKKFNNGSKAVGALIKALEEDNLLIQEAAIQSLGEIGDPKAVPYLIPGLDSKSYAIRLSTLEALEKIGDIQVIPHLKRVAKNESDPYLKSKAASLLANFSSWIIFTSKKDI
jgi:HEAT repeat protein